MTEDDILAFVQVSIRSAWALELLLLLQREAAEWRFDALVRELRGSTLLVNELLTNLQSAGLVAITDDGGYVYRPRSPELAEQVAGLVDLYSRKPITVLQTIFTSPSDKIRSFADAFRFKK